MSAATAGDRRRDAEVDNIMVVGVGGQGVIVAAAIIADTALLSGLDVKLIETRGMSQRGGSVNSHIRIGERVAAPAISAGEVDYLLAFEAAEGLRRAPSLRPGGVAIVDTQQIVPPLASSAEHSYPFDAIERLREQGRTLWSWTATPSPRRSATRRWPAWCWSARWRRACRSPRTWERAIEKNVPPSWLELNLAAFAAGRRAGAAGADATPQRQGARP